MSDLRDLKSFKLAFDVHLKRALESEVSRCKEISEEAGDLMRASLDVSLAGGKRVRPYLFFHGYFGAGGTVSEEEVLQLSVFVELLHIELLILDDVMDRSHARHGVSTLHEVYKKRFFSDLPDFDGEHFSESAAILAATMIAHANQSYLSEFREKFDSNHLHMLSGYYNNVIRETGAGQLHDILLSFDDSAKAGDVYLVHLYKTAKYTIEAPLVGAAIMAGVDAAGIDAIRLFAKPLGLAFQAADDVIGVFGKDTETGKSDLSDLAEGKRTYLTVKAFELANDEQKTELVRLFSASDITAKDLQSFQQILIDTGSKQYSEELMKDYLEKSLQQLQKTDYNEPVKQLLTDLAYFIVNRSY